MRHYGKMDRLGEMFQLQQDLEDKVLAVPKNLERYGSTQEQRVRNCASAIIHEAVELQRLTDYKWWKDYKGFPYSEAKEELIDLWHFLIQASLALQVTPDEVLAEYRKKNAVNHQRVKDNY